jgi:hypothetical protein
MSENINLKEIKRQVYLFYSEDGLADLAIGLMIFGFGIFLLIDLSALVGVLGLLPFLVWYFGKEYLVFPRIGTIQPDRKMKKRFIGFFINMILIGLGVFALYLLNRNSGTSFLRHHPLMLFGFVLGLAISSLGMILNTSRFYLYGLLVFGAMAVGEFLSNTITAVDPYLVAVISAGGIILMAGFVILARFLNKYPIVSLDD